MKVLAVKVNTTGFDLSKDKIFDIGCVLYDVETKCPILTFSTFVPVDKQITSCNNINSLDIDKVNLFADSIENVIKQISSLLYECDCVISCNGREFDRSYLNRFFNNNKGFLERKTWIDIRYDIDYPETCINRSLMYLESFHNFVNPFRGRCVFDCMSILKIGEMYGFQNLLNNARSPLVTLSVDEVSIDIMENKTLLKEKGFFWSDDYRKYVHTIKETFLSDKYLGSLGFDVKLENVEEVINEQ